MKIQFIIYRFGYKSTVHSVTAKIVQLHPEYNEVRIILMLYWYFTVHCSLVPKLCLTLCDPMNYSLPASSVRGIFQARMLQCIAISFSGGSFQPRD